MYSEVLFVHHFPKDDQDCREALDRPDDVCFLSEREVLEDVQDMHLDNLGDDDSVLTGRKLH